MSDRRPLIVGNWKMNGNHLEAIQMVQKLSYRLEETDYESVEIVVAPPFTSLRSIQIVLEQDRIPMKLGAQNVYWAEKGAYTGEVSATMLAKMNVTHVIVGHSERRAIFGETDSDVNKKAKAALSADMTPIVCVGETLEQREAGEAEAVVTNQLNGSIKGLEGAFVVAYEPVWAIGTGRNALPEDAALMARVIREGLRERVGSDRAELTSILYGGSVNPVNIKDLMAKSDIDGALVGGASLDPDKFASIIRYRI